MSQALSSRMMKLNSDSNQLELPATLNNFKLISHRKKQLNRLRTNDFIF